MNATYVHAGDTFFTHSPSLLGELIRWGERDKGEAPSWTNHAGVITGSGWLAASKNHAPAEVIEALWHVRKGPLKLNGTEVRIFRPQPEYNVHELGEFITHAESFVGDKYGWWKLIGFLIKKATGINIPEAYFIDSRPICSYLAAKVNEAARPRGPMQTVLVDWPGFGMDPQAADPDSMLDFCLAHPNEWMEVR